MVSVGTIVWLSSELMFFAALFAAYFTIRSVTTAAAAPGTQTLWQAMTEHLDVPFASVNTFILVASSFTCQAGVFAAEHGKVGRTGPLANPRNWGMREWFILTYLMGATFIAVGTDSNLMVKSTSALAAAFKGATPQPAAPKGNY